MNNLKFVFLFVPLLLFFSCEPEKLSVKTDDPISSPQGSGYDLNSDGKIATVSTSAALRQMLATGSVETIILKSGQYSGGYELNTAKTIQGNKNANINYLIIDSDGTKIDSLNIGNLLATRGIGDGELTLENVTITGNAIFQGGGSSSIKVLGKSDFKGNVSLEKDGLSFKMATGSKISGSVTITRPVNLIPIDDNAGAPVVDGDVILSYESGFFEKSIINAILTKKLIITNSGALVDLGKKSYVNFLVAVYRDITSVTNAGSIVESNLAPGQFTNTGMIGDLSSDYVLKLDDDLKAAMVLAMLNQSLITFGVGRAAQSSDTFDSVTMNFSVQTSLSLPDVEETTTDIVWKSSNDNVLKFDDVDPGKPNITVNRENLIIDTKVSLTASVKINEDKTVSKIFYFNVMKGDVMKGDEVSQTLE